MGVAVSDFGASFWDDENVLKLSGSDVGQSLKDPMFCYINCVSVTASRKQRERPYA